MYIISRLQFIKYTLIAFSLLLTIPLYSSTERNITLKLDDRLTALGINRLISYTRDKGGEALYTDMLARLPEFISHNQDTPLILNYSSDAIWVKIDIDNSASYNIEWIFESRYPLLDDIEIFIITPDGVKIMRGGDKYPGRNRVIKTRTFAFPVTSPPGRSTLMLRVLSEGSLNINLRAWSTREFDLYQKEDLLIQGLFFGIMLAIFIYNLSIFIFVRHPSYLYLVIFIFSYSMMSATASGFSPVYFWPSSDTFTLRAHPFFLFSSVTSIMLFTYSFLGVSGFYPRIYRFLAAVTLITSFFIPLSFILPYRLITQVSVILTLSFILFTLLVAFISLRTCRREAIYFLVSYMFFGVGTFLMAIRAYGTTQESYYEVWGGQTGSAMMVLLLSLGVADKIRTFRDEKEKALLAKKEVENRFQVLFNNAHDGIIIQQHDRIIYANKSLQYMTGYTADELKRINPDSILRKIQSINQDTGASSRQYSGILQSRIDESIDVMISVAEEMIGSVPSQLLIVTDVSSLKEAEATITRQYEEIEAQYEEVAELNNELSNNQLELMEAHDRLGHEKEQLSATIKSITEAVISIDTSMNIILVNPEAERLLGLPIGNITGEKFSTLFKFIYYKNKKPYPDPALSIIQNKKPIISSNLVQFSNSHGIEFILEVTGNPVITGWGQLNGAVIILHDITEKYRLEQEILRVRKIDSLSVLAGGIAHDFNNLLTAIVGNLSIAKYCRPDNEEYIDLLDKIEQAASKATGLTRQLLTFSKGGDPVKRPESIKHLLQADIDFMLTGSKIKGTLEIADDLLNVEVDINQFSQVIQNLIINAIQSMPDGGTLRVMAENVDSHKTLPLKQGMHVMISVIDEGTGIPEENLDKIFDPYFSTKQTGSGLGLASCYSIIKRHGGYIEVKSSNGTGSRFNIYLPATEKKSHGETSKKSVYDFGGATILLLDDDNAVREVAERMLSSLNLKVTSCSSGKDAIALYLKRYDDKRPYDLFITDLVIPGEMSGESIFNIIKNFDNSVRGIAISGYANDPILSNYADYGFAACLSKPFEINALAAVISGILAPED